MILAPAIVAPWILDVRRRSGTERRRVLLAGAVGIGLLLLSYVPLAIQLASTDFGEVRSAIGFLTGGGEPSSTSLPVRIVVIGLRVLAWPLTGLLTDGARRRDPRRGGRRRGDRLAVHRGVGQ